MDGSVRLELRPRNGVISFKGMRRVCVSNHLKALTSYVQCHFINGLLLFFLCCSGFLVMAFDKTDESKPIGTFKQPVDGKVIDCSGGVMVCK